ncbi:MAG: hypothetical protein AB1553_13055 [Nitrospirota bacterium]
MRTYGVIAIFVMIFALITAAGCKKAEEPTSPPPVPKAEPATPPTPAPSLTPAPGPERSVPAPPTQTPPTPAPGLTPTPGPEKRQRGGSPQEDAAARTPQQKRGTGGY